MLETRQQNFPGDYREIIGNCLIIIRMVSETCQSIALFQFLWIAYLIFVSEQGGGRS